MGDSFRDLEGGKGSGGELEGLKRRRSGEEEVLDLRKDCLLDGI